MKIPLLTLFFCLLSCFLKAQQANVQIVLNYFPGSCNVQIEYWLYNPTNGNGSIQIAVSNAAFQWDSTIFSFVKDSSCAIGLNKPDIFSGKPDVDSFSTRTINGTNFRSLDIKRSTKYCDNIYIINPGESKPLATLTLKFRNCAAASAYNFTDTTAYNYIADINDGVATPNPYQKILAIVNKTTRPMDKSGTNCAPGQTINNLNNVPVGDTSSAVFVSQGPLAITKINSFKLTHTNDKVQLDWTVLEGMAIKEFEIQKKNGNSFTTVGRVAYSPLFSNYSFTDRTYLLPGTTYYRIREIATNGKESYSEIKAVSSINKMQVYLYPNPCYGQVTVVLPEGNGTTDINLIDFSGKVIKNWTGYSIPTIQLTGLQKGLYSLLISNRESGEKTTKKITVL